MYDKTLGIVLAALPYNDNTQFLHIYTERFGRVTYRQKLRKTRRDPSVRMLQAPLTILSMEVKHQPTTRIQEFEEVSVLSSPYFTTATNPTKASQCLFVAELLDRTIREEESNPELFTFLHQSVELFELIEEGSANFHLIFTARLCEHLGFSINTENYHEGMCFDIHEGIFTDAPIPHPYYLDADSSFHFHHVLQLGFSDLSTLRLNRDERNTFVETLLMFLQAHLPEMGAIKSFEVLKELFI
jgi:DNA repair protein RecO (recombination protein O)